MVRGKPIRNPSVKSDVNLKEKLILTRYACGCTGASHLPFLGLSFYSTLGCCFEKTPLGTRNIVRLVLESELGDMEMTSELYVYVKVKAIKMLPMTFFSKDDANTTWDSGQHTIFFKILICCTEFISFRIHPLNGTKLLGTHGLRDIHVQKS